ncbi:MAG: hypothetical protein LBF65_01265 [Holosporales bacterium]|jgi:hypothetical protein|nr:hypothetical protein [Holosporales bacterium]
MKSVIRHILGEETVFNVFENNFKSKLLAGIAVTIIGSAYCQATSSTGAQSSVKVTNLASENKDEQKSGADDGTTYFVAADGTVFKSPTSNVYPGEIKGQWLYVTSNTEDLKQKVKELETNPEAANIPSQAATPGVTLVGGTEPGVKLSGPESYQAGQALTPEQLAYVKTHGTLPPVQVVSQSGPKVYQAGQSLTPEQLAYVKAHGTLPPEETAQLTLGGGAGLAPGSEVTLVCRLAPAPAVVPVVAK